MAVTGTITTKFVDEKGVDLGKQLVEKDYLISVYPNLLPQFQAPNILCWGDNQYGTLGQNNDITISSPVQTILYGNNWKAVASFRHSGMIKNDGTLWMTGFNPFGAIGDNTTTFAISSPVQTVAGGTNWKQLGCGYYHTAATKNDGTLWCWGYNGYGNLGTNNTTSVSSPIQVVGSSTNWTQTACGYYYTGAIKFDGTLWLWGRNNYGQLGTNNLTNYSSPVQTVTIGTNWKTLSCGWYHAAAIKADGSLWLWGRNVSGQLGDNTIVGKSSPVQTTAGGSNWKQVSCGASHTAAIKTDGTLWCWGYNYGYLGDNTLTHRSSPVQTIASTTNWKQVACGNGGTYAIKTDGTLWVWGGNTFGQAGTNSSDAGFSSPVQTVGGGKTWKSVVAGRLTTFAIRDANY